MAAQGLIGTEQERASRRLIEQMATILAGLRDDVPAGFGAALFARAAPEDLLAYEARELAALAEETWAFLFDRMSGTAKIRFAAPAGPVGAERIKAVSVLEIVNDDMPFLLDSVLGELNEQGIEVRLVVHPVFAVERDPDGVLRSFRGEGVPSATSVRESVIHIHTDRIDDAARRTEVVAALERVLADVRVCVADWKAMLARLQEVIAELKANPPPLSVDEVAEAVQFLEWLANDNFTFLGFRSYVLPDRERAFAPQFETGLGILRTPDVRVLRRGNELVSMTPEIMEFLNEPKMLIITKANVRSRIHRRAHMDYIGVKHIDLTGTLIGENRFVGQFTASAYTRSTRSIPKQRRKVAAVLTRAGFDPDGHSGKALANVLETYPRDELFQIDEDTLFRNALMVMQLDERPRIRVLARRDRFDRFVSVLVYVPRDRFSSANRAAIGSFLADVYKGRLSAFYPFFPEGPLVRVHFIIARYEGETPDPDRASLEQAVARTVRTWQDELQEALRRVHDVAKAQGLFKRYRNAFSAAYQEAYPAATAVGDIRMIENLSALRTPAVDFYAPTGSAEPGVGLKVWSYERPIPLSERVPVLENMGFRVVDERTYRIEPPAAGEPEVWLHDMLVQPADGRAIDIPAREKRLEACFLVVMRGRAENDGYNALVLAAGLPWRDVALIRTISRFLRQVRVPYSQDYMWATLRKHAELAAEIVALFHVRFDPRLELSLDERSRREAEIRTRIGTALAAVASLDEDRILRCFVNAVEAAIRTNFYQVDASGQPKAAIAIKFASRNVEGMPVPRPLYEIFVYAPRVEGVHLRFGKVARGGVRWSDRPQDFRTEVLGLVKAQQVKNAVIVPVGSKGGFVPKQLPVGGSREAIQTEGVAAYTTFVSSLLDVTDNIGPQGVIAPANVVRRDDDDPYLVVAADKGTATFSDIANGIAAQHGYWLDDAFASGGSAGYDHKKMAITARGAWEAVKRHFRELDVDIMTTPFTVAGVGDMSGDVFGNGMLLAKTIRLVAAFDHRDIFIDPSPDPAPSHAERRRLFDLPRSSWQDYNKDLISAGGGVFSRAAKEIVLSAQAQELLALPPKVTPQDVMRAILRMPVDLLWFGGIGTYVRASHETDEMAGDRANDAIRASAAELKCRVVGEGANLGMTQRGRIEASFRGIKLNTDAIDNSAGVNTSDFEVNIKIALSTPLRDGRLTLESRNALLAAMTDEVADLVLRNNYLQSLSLSLAERRGAEDIGFQQRLMQTLEARGELDRAVEFLPDDAEIAERRRRGAVLTRPELAVLLAYAKLALKAELLDSAVPDDPYLGRELGRYFPKAVSERFPDAIANHRLRREIIATQLANSMINRGGPSLVVRIADQTGASAAAIASAFAAVRDSFGMTALNGAIDALDGKVSGKLQLELYAAVQDLLLDRIVWFLRNVDLTQGLAAVVEHYRSGIEEMAGALASALPSEEATGRDARMAELIQAGVDEALARRLADLPLVGAAPDVILVADRTGKPVATVAATYFAAGAFFKLDRIVGAARNIAVSDYFDRLALDRALDSIGAAERRLAAEMVANGAAARPAVDAWAAARGHEVDRIRAAVDEIAGSGLTLSKLAVAASLLGDLVRD
ncbi:MAG: NAD-glutamate dehydrogenase [Xanthobacteraceae bacterium]